MFDMISLRNIIIGKSVKNEATEYTKFIQNNILENCENDDLLDWLEKDGWRLLPTDSCYARVLRSPCKKFIIRVSGRGDKYTYWASYCCMGQTNPYVPKVYWHMHLLKSRQNVTLMEPLDSIDYIEFKDATLIVLKRPCLFEDFDPKPYSGFGQLINVLRDVHSIAVKFGDIHLDLHGGNVMSRDGQVVITDPFS